MSSWTSPVFTFKRKNATILQDEDELHDMGLLHPLPVGPPHLMGPNLAEPSSVMQDPPEHQAEHMNVGHNADDVQSTDGALTAVILKHFEPGPAWPAGPVRARPALGPPTNLTGRAWVEILKPVNFFGPSPARNVVFSCFTL
jgi:hypothetical protein